MQSTMRNTLYSRETDLRWYFRITERDIRQNWRVCHAYACRSCGMEFAVMLRRKRNLQAACPDCGGHLVTELELGRLVPITVQAGSHEEQTIETLVWEKTAGWYEVRIESLHACVEVTADGKHHGDGARKYADEVDRAIRQYKSLEGSP